MGFFREFFLRKELSLRPKRANTLRARIYGVHINAKPGLEKFWCASSTFSRAQRSFAPPWLAKKSPAALGVECESISKK